MNEELRTKELNEAELEDIIAGAGAVTGYRMCCKGCNKNQVNYFKSIEAKNMTMAITKANKDKVVCKVCKKYVHWDLPIK